MTNTPNLFLIGTAKGGSTSFAFQLNDHPEISFTTEKEPNIFNCADLDACRLRLAEVMPDQSQERYILDASVNYSQYPKFANVPAHIAAICGVQEPRFLYMIRNPVDRAISQYYWRRERYGEDRAIHDAITPDSQYVLSSSYDLQIAQYRAHFPAKHMRFVIHDSYFANVPKAFSEVCNWLGIDDSFVPNVHRVRGATNKKTSRQSRFPIVNKVVRASPALRRIVKSALPHKRQLQLTQALSKEVPREPIDPEQRARILDLFQDSIARTEDLIGQDLSIWR